jgi:hypothetical protein
MRISGLEANYRDDTPSIYRAEFGLESREVSHSYLIFDEMEAGRRYDACLEKSVPVVNHSTAGFLKEQFRFRERFCASRQGSDSI